MRKHAELIRAWAEGAKIQALSGEFWRNVEHPRFEDHIEYRVKPAKAVTVVLYGNIDGLTASSMSSDRIKVDNIRATFSAVAQYNGIVKRTLTKVEVL